MKIQSNKNSTNKTDKKLVENIHDVFTETYTLYLKTQNFHWNFEGKNFYGVHKLLEKNYLKLAEFVDELAERIRSLGSKTYVSYELFSNKSKIKIQPQESDMPGDIMLRELCSAYSSFRGDLLPVIERADAEGDPVTENLLVELLTFLEKAEWMLNSITAFTETEIEDLSATA